MNASLMTNTSVHKEHKRDITVQSTEQHFVKHNTLHFNSRHKITVFRP